MKIEGAEEAPIPSADTMKEWPCVQGKIETLSVTAHLGRAVASTSLPQGVAQGPRSFQARSSSWQAAACPMDKAEEAIKKFADGLPADVRDKRLTQLFAGLFDTINNQRKTVITGIDKYQKSQRGALRGARAPEHGDRRARAARHHPTRRLPPT